jgi:predicted TIM-barrel fold metal-dependent hydrolase
MKNVPISRREFLASSAAVLAASELHLGAADAGPTEPIIDIHQHTNYSDRTDEQLIAHQRAMGVTLTVLLPAGREVNLPSTHNGKSNGLAAKCHGNESCLAVVRQHPKEYRFFANEVPDLPDARTEIEKYLKLGAIGIGEQKFGVDCDSPPIELVAEIAQELRVPVLLHFQHQMYNLRIENFHRILAKYPKVNFIGHAQTWWANIDKEHADQSVLYPKGKVTPGGLTDRLLSEHPNVYGDLSAGSGLNGLTRDEDHARGFLERHQNKLMYGSDCNDRVGSGPECQGAQTIAKIKQLASSKALERKLLYENAKRVLKL